MLELTCSGAPYEIGFHHGSQAKSLVQGSLAYYRDYFLRTCKMDWLMATSAAMKFLPFLESKLSHHVEEMQGIADGANIPFVDILAMNVRTEIAMGMMNDGCTSLGWKTSHGCVAGQNWDWEVQQKSRVILLHIIPNGIAPRPKMSLATEAGLLCKSGVNSAGVACFINAIKARGVNFEGIPVHLGLRLALENESRIGAVTQLSSLGFAAAGHIMIADKTGSTSLEFSHLDVVQLEMDGDGQIAHTNHFLAEHADGVEDEAPWKDTYARFDRISELLAEAALAVNDSGANSPLLIQLVERMLEDEKGLPVGINRGRSDIGASETLYSFTVDFQNQTAWFRLGRPSNCEGIWLLNPADL